MAFINPLQGSKWENLFSCPEKEKQTLISDGIEVTRTGLYFSEKEAMMTEEYGDGYQSNRKYEFEVEKGGYNNRFYVILSIENDKRYNNQITTFSASFCGKDILNYGEVLMISGEILSIFERRIANIIETIEYKNAVNEVKRCKEEEKERILSERRKKELDEINKKDENVRMGSGPCERTKQRRGKGKYEGTFVCGKNATKLINNHFYCGTDKSGCYSIMKDITELHL